MTLIGQAITILSTARWTESDRKSLSLRDDSSEDTSVLMHNLHTGVYSRALHDILSDLLLCVVIFLPCTKMGDAFISLFHPWRQSHFFLKLLVSTRTYCATFILFTFPQVSKASVTALFQHLTLTDTQDLPKWTEIQYTERKPGCWQSKC